MKITFLGTNGWYDTGTGNTVCVLIETGREYIILDAGTGLYKIDRYIKTQKPIYLFISHFHLDHVIGLHTLAKFRFPQGIDVYGPPGIEKFFDTIINRPYTMPLDKLKTRVRVHELNTRCRVPIDAIFRELVHPVVCYGFRFILENKIISYCTDTGICENLYLLGKGANLLISECSLKSRQQSRKWPHLNPETAALAAKRCGAKRLALTHFDAGLYTNLTEKKKAENIASKIFKDTIAAADGTKLTV